MRRRRIARDAAPAGNLDSFLDTLTNTVGVMIFVLLFVTLAAADATVLVRTPLWAESGKAPIYFEVSGDRVALLDNREGSRQVGAYMERLPQPSWYNLADIVRRIYAFSGSTANHEVDVVGSVLSGNLGTRYQLKEGAGEARTALRRPGSAFQRALAEADTPGSSIAFIVRPDGFAAFREARKLAAAKGFESGWEPVEAGEGVVFSDQGRAVGVQ
jgi:hypothetical protein